MKAPPRLSEPKQLRPLSQMGIGEVFTPEELARTRPITAEQVAATREGGWLTPEQLGEARTQARNNAAGAADPEKWVQGRMANLARPQGATGLLTRGVL